MAAQSESEVRPAARASVGMLVTLPTEWADTLRVEVTCPRCHTRYHTVGPGAFSDVASFINRHSCNGGY